MRRTRSEDGSSTLELVLVFPVVLLAIAVVVQAALWAHAVHVVDAAAREGARAARLSGDPADGRTRAEAFLGEHGRTVVLSPAVTTEVGRETAAVTVRGRAIPLLPGITLPLQAASSGPVERFVPAVAP